MHRRLMEHRLLGPDIRAFRNGEGIPLRGKICALLFLWLSLAYSAWRLPYTWAWLILLIPGIGVSTYLLRMKTRRPIQMSRE